MGTLTFVYIIPLEDVSVSVNFKNIRKTFLFCTSNAFRRYVLETITITCFSYLIEKRHSLISLYHSSLRVMVGVSKDSKSAIKAILFLFIFFLVRI